MTDRRTRWPAGVGDRRAQGTHDWAGDPAVILPLGARLRKRRQRSAGGRHESV